VRIETSAAWHGAIALVRSWWTAMVTVGTTTMDAWLIFFVRVVFYVGKLALGNNWTALSTCGAPLINATVVVIVGGSALIIALARWSVGIGVRVATDPFLKSSVLRR
jgi:hypothetical protein